MDAFAPEFPASTSKAIVYQRERVIRTPLVGFRGQLTGSAATLYTAPVLQAGLPTGTSQAAALVKSLIMCNTDTSARTVTVYAIESGGSAADNRAVFKDLSIAAKTTVEYFYPDDCFPLGSGEFIQGLADTTLKVTVRLNVLQLTPT
jgi:hypothetical protein